jgi:hypothetical protein
VVPINRSIFSKNRHLFLLFFISITLFGSDRDQSDLFDNGILGRGFVQKDQAALDRERILDKTRHENAQQCSTQSQIKFDEDCAWFVSVVVFGVATFIESFFVGNTQGQEEILICNPVVESIISAPPGTVSSLGGRVQFRSKLHHLREKFDNAHATCKDEEFYFPYDEKNELFGSKNYLVQYPSGIIVTYTDGQLVRISYDQERNCCQYSVKKNKLFIR